MPLEIITLFVAFVNFFLGLFVYFKNRKNLVNRSFALFSFILGIWASCLYFYSHPIIFPVLTWIKTVYFVGVFPMGLSLLYFSYIFPEDFKKSFLKTFFIWSLFSSPFIYLLFFTNLWVEKVIFKTWGYETILGPGYIAVAVYSVFMIGWIVYNLVQKYLSTDDKILKIQLKYMFLGIFFFVITVTVIDVMVPLFFHTSRFFGLSPVSSLFLVGFTTLAITKYHLFEIRVVLTELLVGIIAIILAGEIFMFKTPLTKILGFGVFFLFCIFGYLLIKSVLKEIHYRQELQKAYEELKVLDKAKSEFISMASHQLRTPLSAIKGYISMMVEGSYGKVPEKVKEKLKNVFQSNERLIKIVNDLLDISKIELGKMKLEKERVKIEDLIEIIYQEMKLEARKKKLNLVWEKPEKPLSKIKIDSLKIRQVISNLIDNAIRYTSKGEIEIKVEKIDSKIQISVKDTGEGLTKEEQEKIFESFTRGAAGITYWIEGAGLGLYIAKKYIELHKGRIWAESKGKGKGSTFFVELPLK